MKKEKVKLKVVSIEDYFKYKREKSIPSFVSLICDIRMDLMEKLIKLHF